MIQIEEALSDLFGDDQEAIADAIDQFNKIHEDYLLELEAKENIAMTNILYEVDLLKEEDQII